MRDIVATIQAEQDEIIRLDHPGVLVIEGGPGTGKTVLALHPRHLFGVLVAPLPRIVASGRFDTLPAGRPGLPLAGRDDGGWP